MLKNTIVKEYVKIWKQMKARSQLWKDKNVQARDTKNQILKKNWFKKYPLGSGPLKSTESFNSKSVIVNKRMEWAYLYHHDRLAY